jgi:hypothetical protein
MGCILALLSRVALLVLWLATPLVTRAFQGNWVLPLLGIIFLPLTTLAYVVAYAVGNGVTGWAWLWVVLGFLFDVAIHTAGINTGRRRAARYRAASQ